jgi:uncharacterized protein DUF6223
MMKYFPHILSACLFIVFMLGITPKLFSQSAQSENKMKITDSTTTTPDKASGYVKGITTARAISLVEGLLGLMSIVIGWRAKARLAKTGARTALALGLLAIILSIVHLTITAGAVFGSGSGKAGSILALVLGLVGCTLSGLALRSRNTK